MPTPKAQLWVDSNPSPKAPSWVGSCPALNLLPWVGSLSPYRVSRFSHTRATYKVCRPFCFPGENRRSCSFLRRHYRNLYRPRVDFTCRRHLFRFGFGHTHRGRHRLRRSPGCSDAHRTADLSIPEFFTGDGPRRDHPFDCVRLHHAWQSSPSVVDDTPTNSDNNR